MTNKPYLQLKPEDEARLLARASSRSTTPKIDAEHLVIAEFGMYFGWGGIEAIFNDAISGDTMEWLLEAARRVDIRNQFNGASGTFTAVASANAKHPSQAFKANTREYAKGMKADA